MPLWLERSPRKQPPEEFESATYDGEVDYRGVLVGEQVTTTLALTFTTGGASVQETTLRFVFDA